MGLALLANLSAHDFGYLSAGQLVERTANALATMERLERHRGHFYNWYDTQTLKPLPPRYVSTVDSGNLAGHLLTLRQGLLALPDQAILGPRVFDGLRDTVGSSWRPRPEPSLKETAPPRSARLLRELEAACTLPTGDARRLRGCGCEQLAARAQEVLSGFDRAGPGPENQPGWWARALSAQCRAALDELTLLAPPAGPDGDGMPTLRECARGGKRPARREDDRDRTARAAVRRTQPHGVRLPVRQARASCWPSGTTSTSRRRDASFYDLLASEARLGSVRRDRPGAAAAGELVRPGPPAHERRRGADPRSPGAARCSST